MVIELKEVAKCTDYTNKNTLYKDSHTNFFFKLEYRKKLRLRNC